MTIEKAHEIAERYYRGRSAWERFRKNSQDAVAKDLGMHTNSMLDALNGKVKHTRLTREQMDEARERLAQARIDRELASRDSIAAIKRDYRISTDTLNKVIDSVSRPDQSVQKFLTMKLR